MSIYTRLTSVPVLLSQENKYYQINAIVAKAR